MREIIRKKQASVVIDEEIEFDESLLLASVTDQRGVICYANAGFCETARFALQDLIGAPHKIVRHPDMPRGVFYLMWSRLKVGKTVCAYVKNRASDGRYYNTFATVVPVQDGYLSVRSRPRADMHALTEELYAEMRRQETEGLTPEKSAGHFEAVVRGMGLSGTDDYMRMILNAETTARGAAAPGTDASPAKISDLASAIEEGTKTVDDIVGIFGQIRGEPVNLRILAGRMEQSGAAIATISKNYETMASEMYSLVRRLDQTGDGPFARMRDAVQKARFSAQLADLMGTHAAQSEAEQETSETDYSEMFVAKARELALAKTSAVSDVASIGATIPETTRLLRRRINGLDLVKLLCRVESGRMGGMDNGLTGIIARLEKAHEAIDHHLTELAAISARIDRQSRAL